MGIDARMLVRTHRKVSAEEVKQIAVRAQIAIGTDTLDVSRPGRWYKNGRHSLTLVEGAWEQDGPDIEPENGETFVEVHLTTRFYGPGYERGNLVGILAVARYMRAAFAPCEVWYGGDSSGVLARHLDDKYEAELWAHFMSTEARRYFASFGGLGKRDAHSVHCDFCGINANENMWSGGDTGHYCPSCGQHWCRYADGRVVESDKHYAPIAKAK